MARNKKVEILSNEQEVLHPMTDGDCVIFEDGKILTQKLSEDDSVKYTPEIVNSSPMFKVGEGNTVDYSDNVLDGAYERATLQGQTYVNYIQESSADEVTLPTPFTEYERTQHNTLTSDEEGTLGINLVGQSYVNALQHDSEEEYVVLGESLEFQEKKVEYTNEGQIKSAMLKGQTLVNLVGEKRFYTNNGTNSLLHGWEFMLPYNLTKGKTYLAVFNAIGTISSTNSKVYLMDNNFHSTTGNTDYPVDFKAGYNMVKCVASGDNHRVLRIRTQIETLSDFEVSDVMLIEYQEGMENWDIPYFEGMQSVTVSTRLENLCHKHTTSSLAKTGKTFKSAGSINDRVIQLINLQDGNASSIYGMKPNTKYLVQFKISNLVLDGLSSLAMQFSTSGINNSNCVFVDVIVRNLINSNGVYRVVLTTSNMLETSSIEIKGTADQWENSGSSLRSMTISEIMYVEYQNGMENWDLPYFEDYQVMKPVQVESVNKNLININNVTKTALSTYTVEGNSVKITQSKEGNGGSFVAYSHYLESGQTYTYSGTFSNPQGNNVYLRVSHENGNDYGQYHSNEETVTTGSQTLTFTCVNSGNHFFHVYNKVYGTTINVGSVVTWTNIQLEESSTATEYVPHQSKTTYSWDEVILRKIGDVEDTLDLTTGEWVQRIGEIVFDASFSETSIIDGAYSQIINVPKEKENVVAYVSRAICDKCIVRPNIGAQDYDCAIYENPLNYVIFDKTVTSADEFKEKYHGAKFCYPLATPIVHKVNLSRPNLQVYDDITHIHTKCLDGTLIPNIYLPSDISYPAILEPSTTYNVCVNHTEVNADNPLKVNVGGTEITMTDSRMTLTTPTTLANSNVSFTGKGNKIKESMLIKNSSLLTRDLPHFNGIGSVQLGKTIKNLCGSNGYMSGVAAISPTFGQNSVQFTITKAGSCVWVFPIIRPLDNGKKYFVYAPNTYPSASAAHVSFRHLYDNQLTFAYGEMVYPISKYTTFTINQDKNQFSHIVIGNHGSVPLNSQCALTYPIICEYEPGMEDWDWESIGYFTGTRNIGNEFMRIGNKNLFDGTFYGGYFDSVDGNGIPVSVGSLTVYKTIQINLKKGEYTISFPEYCNIIRELKDGNVERVNTSNVVKNYTFIINNDGLYAFAFRKTDSTNIPDNFSVQIEESSTATTYTAHKHNGLYITKDQPIDLTWEQGRINPSGVGDSYTNAINNAVSYGIRTKGLLNLKPNTTYRVSLGDKTNFKYHIAVFDNSDNALSALSSLSLSGDWVSSKDTIFTTTKDAHKIGINVQKQDASSITPSEINHVRLEEVTDVVLRSIGDVCDELDITRGIYTQRIGEIVLNGSEAWTINTNFSSTYTVFYTMINDTYDRTMSGTSITDKFNNIKTASELGTVMGFYIGSGGTSNKVAPFISSDKTTTEELRQWLEINPVKVQYKLATPIAHKVHIGNKNEANTEVTKPNDVFTLPTLYTEQTHIDLTNNGIIPKVQSRDYIAYPVIPMVSRTYTLQHNLTGGVSNLTVDLLGRTQSVSYQNHKSLVYTPETMDAKLHDELRISGKGKISRVMYIDGGYMDRDIPYIEGMKNAVNPIVKNIGKNLFSGDLGVFDIKEIRLDTPIKKGSYYISGTPNTLYTTTPVVLVENKALNQSKYGYINNVFNINFDIEKITVYSNGYSYINSLGKTLSISDFMISDNKTEYEPYKENICYVDCGDETIYLRSLPNGVCDEIDLETGKYIQRVGEVVLDGSSDEFWKTYQTNDYGLCQMYTETSDYAFPNHYTVSNKLPNINDGFGNVKIPSIRVPESRGIYIRLKQEWLYESSEIGFKQYLSENPITVQYELAEPIVKDIVIHNYPHSYEGGHVIIESGDPNTPIPAQITYRAVTNRSGQIQQHTEQVEKQEREINELETLILANIHLSQTR